MRETLADGVTEALADAVTVTELLVLAVADTEGVTLAVLDRELDGLADTLGEGEVDAVSVADIDSDALAVLLTVPLAVFEAVSDMVGDTEPLLEGDRVVVAAVERDGVTERLTLKVRVDDGDLDIDALTLGVVDDDAERDDETEGVREGVGGTTSGMGANATLRNSTQLNVGTAVDESAARHRRQRVHAWKWSRLQVALNNASRGRRRAWRALTTRLRGEDSLLERANRTDTEQVRLHRRRG